MSWNWFWLLAVLDFAFAVGVTIHAVLRRRDTRAVIAWVGLAWLAPIVGAVSYFALGINRIERKGAQLQLRSARTSREPTVLTPEELERRDEFARRHPHLVGQALLVRELVGRTIEPGNEVHVLRDGDEAFPAMREAIDSARHSVSLLSYIFDSDRAGDAFLDSLRRACDRGVAVRVLIDDVGSRYSRPNMVRRLRDAGVRVEAFLPTRVPRLLGYANLRNHRKILVVDGRIGFTGGTNIREGHCLELSPGFPVKCLHFRFQGPVVAHLQEAFAVDWAFAAGESLSDDAWFPPLERQGDVWCRGIPHGPDEDFEKMTHTILGALSVAQQRIDVVTPYFLPDAAVIQALNVASMKGVDVRVVLPGSNNVKLVEWASEALFWQLLEKGVRLFLTPPPFDHTKLLTVDRVWSLVGSTNWDPRSLRLNFEYNVECYDEGLAEQLTAIVDAKVESSTQVTLEMVRSWGFVRQLRNGLTRLLSPYL